MFRYGKNYLRAVLTKLRLDAHRSLTLNLMHHALISRSQRPQ